MYLLPAIDLKGGQCVRLRRGDMSQATVFNTSAGQQARSFAREGAEWIHIVDLDGAFAGSPVNVEAVEDILKSADVKTELGGGIRSLDVVKMWLDKGVERVILGTQALRDPDFVKRACDMFPHRIAVGIDAKDGKVAVEGWAETSEMQASDLARRFENAGVRCHHLHGYFPRRRFARTEFGIDGGFGGTNYDARYCFGGHIVAGRHQRMPPLCGQEHSRRHCGQSDLREALYGFSGSFGTERRIGWKYWNVYTK